MVPPFLTSLEKSARPKFVFLHGPPAVLSQNDLFTNNCTDRRFISSDDIFRKQLFEEQHDRVAGQQKWPVSIRKNVAVPDPFLYFEIETCGDF